MATTRSVLIIGGSGFMGTHLALRMREQFKVFATSYTHPIRIPGVTSVPLAVDNRNWLKRIAYLAKPDVVIYAAGSNSVAKAEANPRLSDHIHLGGPAAVADVAEILQPKFIYLSNCYVYDGARGNYHETDTVLPATALGKSKVGGENYVRGRSLNWVIVRASPLIGRGNSLRTSLLDRIRIALQHGERIELDNNEFHSYAPVRSLADLIVRIVEGGTRNRLLHFGGLTKLTQYDLGMEIAARFGFDASMIVPARAAGPARRDYSLNSTQAVEMLKIKPLLLEESLDLIEKDLVAGA